MKIATWNVNSLTVRLPHVLDFLKSHAPDVLALQEIKLIDEKFPLQAFSDLGYKASFIGQKTYNGVALISRQPLTEVQKGMSDFQDPQSRLIAATLGRIRFVNVYIPNGQSPESDKYTYKLNWLAALARYLKNELQCYPHLVLLGDFNIAPCDLDVHDPNRWVNQVLCTTAERSCFQTLLTAGLVDSFRLYNPTEKSYSWWDYRQGAFFKGEGLRIDHILVSRPLESSIQEVFIDKEPRKATRPSDHAPVVLTIHE